MANDKGQGGPATAQAQRTRRTDLLPWRVVYPEGFVTFCAIVDADGGCVAVVQARQPCTVPDLAEARATAERIVEAVNRSASWRTWLVYSLRRQIWWRANQAGYTQDVREAGRYVDGEALAIAERMNYSPGGDDQVKLVPANRRWLEGDAP